MNTNKVPFLIRLLWFPFFVSLMFPYVTLIKTGSDIQPYCLLFSFFVLLICGIKRNQEFLVLMYIFFVSSVLLLFSGFYFSDFRSYLSVVSFAVILCALSSFYGRGLSISSVLVRYVIIVYIFFGVIQLVVAPDIFLFLSPRNITYGGFQGRGVDSLTAEPTFFGLTLLLLFLIHERILRAEGYNSRRSFQVAVLVFLAILLIAKSSTSMMAFFPAYIMTRNKLSEIYLPTILGVIFFIVFYLLLDLGFFSDLRINSLLGRIDELAVLVEEDLSLNDRFFNAYYSIQGFFNNFFMPHGFGAWDAYAQHAARHNVSVTNLTSADQRILSLVGGLLFEFGFLSIPIFYYICRVYFKMESGELLLSVLQLCCFIFIFIQAVPFSHPLFVFYVFVCNNLRRH